jgi:hypothetical protein
MSAERTLPARMYLLAYDLTKDKPDSESWLDHLVRIPGAAHIRLAARFTDRHSRNLRDP